eukprot:11669478-Alexandrium_andersonii.AAC.1
MFCVAFVRCVGSSGVGVAGAIYVSFRPHFVAWPTVAHTASGLTEARALAVEFPAAAAPLAARPDGK